MTQTVHLPPIPDADWPDRIASLRPGFAGSLNVYRVMAHHPALLEAWAGLRQHVVLDTALGPQRSEIVILRAGYRLGSRYEWAQHVVRGRNCGLTDARIRAMQGPTEGMAPEDAILARAVDQLFDAKALDAEMQRDLVDLVGTDGMMDLIATVGFYTTLGFILNSFETPLDEAIADELARNPLAPD
ncbi:carboxymuconolactone decarboxylase family protein [Maritalea mobilis]|uniref:carboxymuconolactone decarboxylase family protein n=1 Tax=Maritalea mobilis TaxID=483324 RepID=UPI0021BBCF10|nr:carboxymuconolactone decarboxylase family protein [Maritalea mobilis]